MQRAGRGYGRAGMRRTGKAKSVGRGCVGAGQRWRKRRGLRVCTCGNQPDTRTQSQPGPTSDSLPDALVPPHAPPSSLSNSQCRPIYHTLQSRPPPMLPKSPAPLAHTRHKQRRRLATLAKSLPACLARQCIQLASWSRLSQPISGYATTPTRGVTAHYRSRFMVSASTLHSRTRAYHRSVSGDTRQAQPL